MPQFGMLMMLTILLLVMLSVAPRPAKACRDRAEHHADCTHHPFRGTGVDHFSPGRGPGDGVFLPGAGLDWLPVLFSLSLARFAKRSARWPDRLTAREWALNPVRSLDHEQ